MSLVHNQDEKGADGTGSRIQVSFYLSSQKVYVSSSPARDILVQRPLYLAF